MRHKRPALCTKKSIQKRVKTFQTKEQRGKTRKGETKKASVASVTPEQANEPIPGQSNEAIRSQLEQEEEQPTLPNENNVPAKKNPGTT